MAGVTQNKQMPDFHCGPYVVIMVFLLELVEHM